MVIYGIVVKLAKAQYVYLRRGIIFHKSQKCSQFNELPVLLYTKLQLQFSKADIFIEIAKLPLHTIPDTISVFVSVIF